MALLPPLNPNLCKGKQVGPLKGIVQPERCTLQGGLLLLDGAAVHLLMEDVV